MCAYKHITHKYTWHAIHITLLMYCKYENEFEESYSRNQQIRMEKGGSIKINRGKAIVEISSLECRREESMKINWVKARVEISR